MWWVLVVFSTGIFVTFANRISISGTTQREYQDIAAPWAQCGGTNWAGPTQCGPGYYCFFQNQYYSQCIPGTGISAATATPPPTSTTQPSASVQPTFASQLSILTSCLGTTLSSQLYSPVLNPGTGDTSYYWLRTSNNNMHQRYPAAVLMIQNINQVSLAVKCAQASGIQPVARSGGHSYEGLSSLDGKLVIDVSFCNSIISIFEDPVGSGNYKAKFESGIRLGKMYTDLWNNGQWSFIAGECAWVGAGGHMTGGGQGMQSRLYGLAIDQITAIDVVLANASTVTATASSYSDLFWALRGAGSSSYGVVTHFTVNIYKFPQNAVFTINFQSSIRIWQLWQTIFVNADSRLGAYIHLQQGSFDINGHFLGSTTELESVLSVVLSDPAVTWYEIKSYNSIQARSYVRGWEDMSATAPIDNSKGPLKSKSEFVAQLLPDSVLQVMVNTIQGDGSIYMGSHLLGGSGLYGQIASDATAYPARNAWYCMEYGTWVQYSPGNQQYNDMHTIQAALAPYVTGLKYYNWIDLEFPISSYFGANLPRLMAIKAKYDPGNFFNGPLTIPLPPPVTSPTAEPTSEVPSSKPTTNPTCNPSVCPSSVGPTTAPSFRPSTFPSAGPSISPTLIPSRTPTISPTIAPSSTRSPTYSPSSVPTSSHPTIAPSVAPSLLPTAAPTFSPSRIPSLPPSTAPSPTPTVLSTSIPSSPPTYSPSSTPPTYSPSMLPTALPSSSTPTSTPSSGPSKCPTNYPSFAPTAIPTNSPSTTTPSYAPTVLPTAAPSTNPSKVPSRRPTTLMPTTRPSGHPTAPPSTSPTILKTSKPSTQPSKYPSVKPSVNPSIHPSTKPSIRPTAKPTYQPTLTPSKKPSAVPTTRQPTTEPTVLPSATPTAGPSTSVPTTGVPITAVPTTLLPTSEPTVLPSATPTAGPSTSVPTTGAPVTAVPTTNAPTTHQPN